MKTDDQTGESRRKRSRNINPKLLQLGQRIRKLRTTLTELSQEQLAYAVGLHPNYVSGTERGERNIGYLNLCKIADGLSMSVSELLDFDQPVPVRQEGSPRRAPSGS